MQRRRFGRFMTQRSSELAPFDEAEVRQMVARLREDKPFLKRLCEAAQAAEPTYPPSPHVEEQLYEHGFPTPEDEALMKRFHSTPWAHRTALAASFADGRYQRLARRLIYFERPELLGAGLRAAGSREISQRLLERCGNQTRWRSIPAALREAEALLAEGELSREARARLAEYRAYLLQRQSTLPVADTESG